MSSKEEKIRRFDPNGVSTGKNLYGLPFNEQEADIIVLPVPWEVTVSFSEGTARAPKAILEASKQVDLYDPDVEDAWKRGIFMKKIDKEIYKRSKSLRKKAVEYLEELEEGEGESERGKKIRDEINAAGKSLKNWVKQKIVDVLKKKKLPVLLGGDHSTLLGLIEALAQHNQQFGILHIDAHCDLRN